MPAPKRDSQHRTRARGIARPRDGSLDHRERKHDSIPAANVASVLSLPPLESQEHHASSPAFMYEPQPGRALSTGNLSPAPTPLSMVELPHLVAEVGPELAMRESLWMEGPCLIASALGTDIPVKATQVSFEESALDSFTDHGDVSQVKMADQDKETEDRKDAKHREPLTGTEVVEIFAKKRHLGKLQFFHLQAVNNGPFRPYDLRVVPPNRAGTEHFIFSPSSVLHVQDGCSAGLLSLAEWHREAILWRALQDIPFFRDYLLRKAFIRWHRSVCKITLQRKGEVLQGLLLMAVPQFRDALFQFSRLIEELKGVHWLPQDECKTYTLLDFQNALMKKNQECRRLLEIFLQYRALILNMVQEDSYGAHQELQLLVEHSQLSQRSQPLYLQLAHLRDLRKELGRAEYVLQQLGNMAALADHMIVQGIVTIAHREVTSFLNNVMKRVQPQQGSLFQAELIFGADGQPTLFPPMHLFQEVLRGALLSVANSALQVFDTCSYCLDAKESVSASTSLTSAAQELSPDLSLTCTSGSNCITAFGEKDSEPTGVSSFSSKREPHCVLSAPRLVLPKLTPLMVQGQRLRGQYYPLSSKQLEWQLSLNAGAKEVQKEQARISQEAGLEIQQLCEGLSWLVDIHLFTSQWSPASLETMRGMPALRYEEHIQKVRFWTDRVRTVPPSLTTSNKLLIVTCSHIQEKIGPLLNSIEEDVLTLLNEELKLRSENLILELKRAVEGLRVEPTDFNDFTHYASMVKRCAKMSDDMQHQLEYLHSLQETVRTNYRQMTPDELLLEEQMLDLWDIFVPLLKQGADTVCQRLPSMADTLDNTFSSLAHDLDEMVTKATSGPYLDPTQNAAQMLNKLKIMCRQVYAVSARLTELSRTSKSLRGNPLDLTFVTTAKQKMEARKGLWELMTVSTSQIQEWRLLLFSKFVVSRAQEKVDEWLQQAVSLARTIPSRDAVLQETLGILERFNQQLPVLAKLSSPTLKHKHWRNIFKGMGLLYAPEWNLTVADLMSKKLREHQNKISKICQEAKAEADMEQAFRKLQRRWEGALFRLAKFIVTVWQEDKPQLGATRRKKPTNGLVSNYQTPIQHSRDSGTFTIIGLETLLAQTQDSVMTLSNMLLSPHVAEFRLEVEHWVQLLQELEELLDFFERYQQKWVFLSKMFYETTVSVQKAELLNRFLPVDKTFKEIIQTTLRDPHVLNIVRLRKTTELTCCFHGHSLRVLLIEGLSTMEGISNQLLYLLGSPRREFPRLCFLSDGEVIKLLSLHPTPSALLPLVRKCFRGVRWLEVDSKTDMPSDVTDLSSGLDLSDTQMCVRGVYGSVREHVPFLCPLEPNLNPLVWLCLLELQLQQAMKQLMKQCAVARHQFELLEPDPEWEKKVGDSLSHDPFRYTSPSSSLRKEEGKEAKGVNDLPSMWSILSDYPLQCLLVTEEALWCSEVRTAYKASAPVKWSRIKAQNASKLQSLCQAIQDGITGDIDKSMTTQRMVTVLHALVLLTMNHSQQLSRLMEVKCDLESSFEWQSLMKYHLITDTQNESTTQEGHHDLCYVEILGTQLPYGYEYLGPEHWILVNTPSTDRAILGILLALTSYRCGFVSGPCMSGKRKTVVQLGRALGRQVISLQCCVNTSPSVVQQMLFGALQTGAWLVLDCVDLMTQGVLSQLGQHLSDIHQSLSILQRNTQQKGFETHTKPLSSFSNPDGDGTVSPRDSHGDIWKECRKSNELECQISFSGENIFAKLSYGCVIISSRGYTTEVPENLRVATRPISLAHPDYRIITEVMLVSLGFSDAVSISRRLISLFSLAKDSLCLPDSVSGEQTSWMVLLRNVIAASGTHLRSNSRLDVHMEKVLREEPDAPRLPLDGILNPPETDGGDKCPQSTHYKSANQSAALMQAVLEEQAVVNSVLSILLSAIFEQKKASQFRTIFEEIFPVARSHPILQQYIEEEGEQNILKTAVTEELQQTGFHADTKVLRNALTLYQAMKLSRAVLLVGPAGSGKTTCYRALAGALRRLAARAEEAEFDEDLTCEGDGMETDYQSSTSNWSSVDTVVLFPNALSHEELFGGCYEQQGSWWDGAFTKVLRGSEQHDLSATTTSKKKKTGGQTRKGKWLVMDGEPLGQPGWLDSFSTLCNPEDPFLCLSSGEKVRPSHKELKLLAEVTDLGDAAPSAVTRCNLVYLSGKDLWKAVWKVEMDALYREHSLDQGTLKMWNRLAEDIFSSTLTFIRHKALTPVMHSEGDGSSKFSKGITYGLQEVNSFIRILHALLEQFGKGRGLKATPRMTDKREMNPVGAHPTCTDALIPSTQQEIQARNLFLVAYIWGFGGHLHPRHWPQFDLLAREALFESRYRVEVPSEGTVFEHFFNLSEGMMGDTSNPINCSRSKSPQMVYTTVPQYEKYAYLLDLMLEAKQPAMLVGEAGSGKTMLCHSLLSQDRAHIRLPASPRLRSTDLRNVLESMGCQKTRLGTMGTMIKQPGLLLFVDDLHEAPCDAFGKTSMALETLRQCISRGGVLTSDGYHFKLFSSGAISYLGTCRTSGVGNQSDCNRISSRLSRHFSILVLPSLSVDVLFSIHSPQLQNWLKEFPCMPRYMDMARCIITATLDLYYAVCEQFQPNVHRPHFLFSMHDLQKVFHGICLWAPRNSNRQSLQKKISLRVLHSSSALPCFAPATLGPAANMLNIARLWMHECLRTFGDRLCSEDEGQALVSLIAKVSERHYSSRMTVKPQTARAEDTPCAASTRPSTHIPPPTPTDYQKTSHQRPSTPNQPAKSPLPIKAETHTEQEEQAECSDRVSSSDSSSWGSSEDDLFGEIYPQKQENDKKKHVKKPLKKDVSLFQPTQLISSSHQALDPSPPKGPKPVNQSDWKRSHKLCEQTPQTEPSPARPLVPLQLLQDMETTIQHVVFSVELLEPLPSMSQQHNFKRNSAYLERDLGLLVQQLAFTVKSKGEEEEEEFDDNYRSTSSYTVHRQRVCQLVHVLRALLIPGGHGALFGAVRGTGRKTTVRLAAYLTGYQLIEVHPGNESQLREMLREAGGQAGVHGGNVVILVHEETSQAARDELIVVMADGTFPGLYSDEELKNLVLRINALIKNSRNRLRDDQALEKYFRQTQRNVHVFLLLPFSPDTSEMLPENASVTLAVAHMTKALSLCCCVEVYQPWSTQSLVEAAFCRLRESLQIPDTESKVDRDVLVGSISEAMAGIHQSACKYASILHPDLQPFSPQTFLELIAHFFHLCSHLCEQGRGQANRVSTILARVKDMTDTAEQNSQEVVRLKRKIAETQKCLYPLQRVTDTERTLCERARQHCLLEENRLSHLEEQTHQAQQQAEDAFKEVSPLYQTALDALQSLSTSDLVEVRRYRFPPDGVIIVMDAICLLFNRPRNWESSKQLLGQSNFFQELEFFDRSMLSDDLFRQLGQIVPQRAFLPESVRGVSRACESLCRWVRAVYQYACVQRHMAPQEARKKQLEVRMAESRARLRVARLQEEEAREQLEDMERQQQFLRMDLEELTTQLRKAETLERKAAAAVQQVQCHITDWTAAAKGSNTHTYQWICPKWNPIPYIVHYLGPGQETEMNNQTISGDALLLAATITYLGPFLPDVRMVLLGKWRELCLSGHININPEDPRTSLLPNPASVAPGPLEAPLHVPIPMGAELQMALARAVGVDHRQVLGVPPRLVLKLLLWGYRGPWAQHWPLLADAQQHEMSAQAMLLTGHLPGDDTTAQREGEYELVVSADDPDLLDKVRQGSEKGLRVLVTHVERAVPSPEFLEVLMRPAGSHSPGLRRPVQTAHPEFCLFLSTPLPVRLILNEIHPSILSEVYVIDLSLSSTEVQELMLTELVQSECLELWVQHCLVNTDKKALQDKLCQEEVSLMEYILQSFTPLLQDPEFLPRVSACQTASQKLQAEIMELSLELERHKPLLADFHRVAGLATALYQALQEVARLSPFYLFPLRNFLFAVRGTLVLKGRPDVTFSGEVVTGAVMAEITHRMVSHLLAQYRPCLFQSHATLLRLLVSVALFLHNEDCSEVERLAFLRGLGDMDLPVDASTPTSPPPSTSPSQHHVLPSWVPPHTHTEVLRLHNIPAFTGLLSSLATSPSQWQEYLRFPSSTVVGPVPCRSHSHLSTLQRALLWKTMLPHCLAAVAEDLAACHLGQPVRSAVAGAPHTGSPEALSRFLNKHNGPVIVTLPGPSRDGWASIQPLHWLKQVSQYQTDKRGVKVISFGAKCQKEVILSALKIAVRDGNWLVFNNCHLLDQWDDEVVCQLNQLISCAAKGHQTDVETEGLIPVGLCAGSRVHPRFRLWFITRGYNPLSIPASMRVCALRLVCDSPWDVKEELCSSLRQVVSVTSSAPTSGVTACTMEPMLRAAILHSVLLQRQAYKHLGQGNIYHWTQEDLLALVDAQVRIAKVCGNPTGALEYIAANLVYGGHVADLADLEAVESVSRACLRAAPPLWGSGPHTLSDIIHIPSRCDLSGLLQSLEQRVQALANTSDPLVLGFSAGLAEELVKVHSHTLNTLLQDSQKPFGRVWSTNKLTHPALLPDFTQARDRLLALKESLGRKDDIRVVSVGAPSLGPLRYFLQAEWDGLVDVVSSLHSELNQPMRNSKPTVSSLLTVSSLFRLERRAELLKAYLCDKATSGPSNAYRLSAFSNARGFLGALIREAAHAKQRDISNISLHFQVLSATTSPASLPLSGVYLCGLELRGALWDTRLGALQDTLSPQPCLLPLLWVRARVRNTDTVRAPDSPPCNTSSLPLYHCPLYLDREHGDSRYWELAENNIITRVPLLAKLDPVLCTLRRVRLVSTL
ncbi:dynein heavy chain domain-containing protein 1 [Oncorhynchus kisutch]|uniref:dynein heavy chain domain-containing protein 1 n=1 Tax=Oncorhynchus kisutch TaxID=8019 RepID=UPI0012DC2684|nr:dynein heavy chain domain-containing protein 1 [Oncorhynchus kisutch]